MTKEEIRDEILKARDAGTVAFLGLPNQLVFAALKGKNESQ